MTTLILKMNLASTTTLKSLLMVDQVELWRANMVHVTRKRLTEQELHAMILVFPSNLSWWFSTIYASTDNCIQKIYGIA